MAGTTLTAAVIISGLLIGCVPSDSPTDAPTTHTPTETTAHTSRSPTATDLDSPTIHTSRRSTDPSLEGIASREHDPAINIDSYTGGATISHAPRPPATPTGDSNGAAPTTFVFDGPLLFGHDSTALSQHGIEELRQFNVWIETQPELCVMVSAHASPEGHDTYNLRLSQGRLQAVLEHLDSGCTLWTVACGSLVPATDDTGQPLPGLAAHRRVEIAVIPPDQTPSEPPAGCTAT